MDNRILDTQGLKCPLPVLKARKALSTLPCGEALEVIATDPGSVTDFEEFCSATGTTLVSITETDGVFRFILRRSNDL